MVGFLRRGADFLSYGQQLAPANGCSASSAATSKTRQMSSDPFAVPRSGFAIKRAMISKSRFNKRERCICLRLLGCTLALSRDYSGLSRQCQRATQQPQTDATFPFVETALRYHRAFDGEARARYRKWVRRHLASL